MAPAPSYNDTVAPKSTTTATTADPWTQTVDVYDAYGSPLAGGITLNDVNMWAQYGIRASINWGSQLGASLIMVILLLVLTKHDKRRSPIFICNIVALVLSVVRGITNVTFYTSEWYNFYTYASGDISRVPTSDYTNSVAACIMTLLLLVCAEVSLMLQTNVVCATLARPPRFAITLLSVLVALTAISTRMALTVYNIRYILDLPTVSLRWLAKWSNITSCFTIFFFSMVFCAKLGLAIRNRRRLGLKQFGPMQVVFIMGAQTLIVPGVCSVLQFFTNDEIGALSLTLVAIFLPLSSVWAAANTEDRNQASRGHDAHHRFLGGLKWRKAPGERRSVATSNASRKSMATLNTSILSSQGPVSPCSKKTASTFDTEKTWTEQENGRGGHIFETGRAMNETFP